MAEISNTIGSLFGGAGQADNQKARDLVAQGWRITYAELFGQSFVDALDSAETDDKHHSEAIEWHWNARIALLKGERPPNDWFAYFPVWSRANMKTTTAERIVCTDAFLSFAFDQPGFCLYIGREKDRVTENIGNVEALLAAPNVKKYAPSLSQVLKDKETNEQGKWTASLLQTQSRYTIKGATLNSAQAGSKIKDTRVTFFLPDDIDDREESVVEAETRFRKLTTEILPMKQANTLTFFAQNYINRYSVMYRIHKGQAKVLTNRKPTKPVPAVRDLVTEERTVDGVPKDVVVSGRPTWRGWDLQRVQDEIDTYGLPAFLRECQHEVDQSKEGRFHKKYNDKIHAISYSQFASVYGSRDAWKNWYKVPFSDWARTKTKFHANVAGYLAVSNANTKYPAMTFCIPLSFPADTEPENVAERLLNILTPYAYGKEGNQTTWATLIDESWKRLNADHHFASVSDKMSYRTQYYKNTISQYSKKVLSAYNVSVGAMSHSEDKVRNIFNQGFGFTFTASNPAKTDALEDIDMAMKYDINEPHIFDSEKKGYTRFYVLCKDDFTKPPKIINGIEVYPPVPYPESYDASELHDDDLFRFQMTERRFRPPKLTETGEIIGEAEKLHDDFGQALQMVYFKGLLTNIRLSKEEREEAVLPERYRLANINQKAETGQISGETRAKMLTMRNAVGILQKQRERTVEKKKVTRR